MRGANVGITAVGGTKEKRLLPLVVVGGAVPQLTLPAISWRLLFAVLGRGIAVLSEWRSCPFRRRYHARSTVEVLAKYLIRAVIQLFGAKKKPVHRHTNPNGSFPLAGVLVWLSMYRLKSRIQLAHQMGVLV